MHSIFQAPDGAVPTRVRGNYVLLRGDTLRLLLPQEDVESTEYLEDVPSATEKAGVFVWTHPADAPRRVLALADRMTVATRFPEDRFLVSRLQGESQDLFFAWSEVRVLIDAEIDCFPLPQAMRTSSPLVDAYTELEGEVAFCTDARRVIEHATSTFV